MPKRFTCANGHEWEATAGGGLALAAIACPTCGAAAETAVSSGPANALATTAPEPQGRPMPSLARSAGGGKLPGRFGRYTIKKLIGQGGMGAVYLAHDSQLDREVALKVPRGLGNRPEVLQRFYREARTSATFHHPNLCPVYEVGEQDGVHYLTMPFIQGHSLGKHLEKTGRLPLRQAAALVRKLALAMHEAHTKGVVHRDLKPGNIMLNKRGEPIIMDFGLARRDEAADQRLTHSGAIMGTPAYMPPEQVSGDQQAIGPCTDIYSLGVILYELLTGRLPFQGAPALQMGLVMTIEPDPPSRLRPDLDGPLEAICLRAMMKNPADRYASMKEFADDLTGYLKAKAPSTAGPGKLRPQEVLAFPELDDESNQQASSPAQSFGNRLRRPSILWLVAGTGIALTLLLIGILILNEIKKGKEIALEPGQPNPTASSPRSTESAASRPAATKPTKPEQGAATTEPADSRPEPEGRKGASAASSAPVAPAEAQGFVPLFNGKDLTGWSADGGDAGQWKVENGVIVARSPHYSKRNYLLTDKAFSDFVLHFEFVVDATTSGGVALRATPGEKVPLADRLIFDHPLIKLTDPGRNVADATGASHWLKNGSIGTLARSSPNITVGAWHRVEITVQGPVCTATLDGKQMVDLTLDPDPKTYNGITPGLKRTSGKVGFQINTGTMRYRNIELKELRQPDQTQAQDHYSRGRALAAQNDYAGARAAFRQAIECDPKHVDALNSLAWLLATVPDPAARDARQAVELAKKAVALSPEHRPTWNTLGVTHYRAGDHQDAALALNKSMELSEGGDSFDWFFLAMTHWRLGRKVEARKWYEQAAQWMDDNKADDAELRRFRIEAEELLEIGFEPLFNGKDLTGWLSQKTKGPAPWSVQNGYIECKPGNGDIVTSQEFGPDLQLHVEFWLPNMPNAKGQFSANSGIFLLGRWEVQILDSYKNETDQDTSVGALYKVIAPNREAQQKAIKPPEQWNTFDITFRSPRIDAQGQVTAKGEITVVLNGLTIIDKGKFDRPTAGAIDQRMGVPGPILLQEHGSKVRFRNVAVKELPGE